MTPWEFTVLIVDGLVTGVFAFAWFLLVKSVVQQRGCLWYWVYLQYPACVLLWVPGITEPLTNYHNYYQPLPGDLATEILTNYHLVAGSTSKLFLKLYSSIINYVVIITVHVGSLHLTNIYYSLLI